MTHLHLIQNREPGAYEPLETANGPWSRAAWQSDHAEAAERDYFLLISGGLLALASYVGMFLTGWAVWVSETLGTENGLATMFLLLLPYAAGLLLFGYGYKFSNWPDARRLALIWGSIGLALLLVFFTITYIWKFLASLAPGLGGGDDSGSNGNSDSDSSSDSDSAHSSHSWGWNWDASPRSEMTSLATCGICGQQIPGGIGSKCPRCPAVT